MVVADDADTADELRVKVIDFGLAKSVVMTQAGNDQNRPRFSGTPGFASPEQLTAGDTPPDARSDIYSLGVTIWYLLSGKLPFSAADNNTDAHRDTWHNSASTPNSAPAA